MTGQHALQVQDLTFHYPNASASTLANISFALPPGSLCMILGANGAGKSTLLKLLAGRLPRQQGKLHCQGEISYIPQTASLSLAMNVLERVLVGRAEKIGLLQAPGKTDYQCCEKALRQVGMQASAHRDFSSLSGGEQQLVLVAQALASGARIILLDEVTAAMDWHNQAVILHLLRNLADQGYTVVFSTHSPQHAFDFASHCLLMFGDARWRFGPPHQVINDRSLSQLYNLPVRCLHTREPTGGTVAVPQFLQVQGGCML